MVLIVKIEDNEGFRRNGDDIYIDDVDINLYECLVDISNGGYVKTIKKIRDKKEFVSTGENYFY